MSATNHTRRTGRLQAWVPLALATVALISAALPAGAAEIIELRGGRLIEANTAEIVGKHLVLDLPSRGEATRKQMRVLLTDVEPWSAARVWTEALEESDAAEWRRLARFARANHLYDVAEHGLVRAAAANSGFETDLESFRAARPREESKHHFNSAHEQFRDGHLAAAKDRALAATDADPKGTYAALASELLDMVAAADTAERTSVDSAQRVRERRKLRQLEALAERGENRLRAARAKPVRARAHGLHTATRTLAQVNARLERLSTDARDGTTREATSALLRSTQARTIEGLQSLADLHYQAGKSDDALAAVHDVLALDPQNDTAQELRDRILDDAQAAPGHPYLCHLLRLTRPSRRPAERYSRPKRSKGAGVPAPRSRQRPRGQRPARPLVH